MDHLADLQRHDGSYDQTFVRLHVLSRRPEIAHLHIPPMAAEDSGVDACHGAGCHATRRR